MSKQKRNEEEPITYLYVSGICLVLLIFIFLFMPSCDGYGCIAQLSLFILVPILAFLTVSLFVIFLIKLIIHEIKEHEKSRTANDQKETEKNNP